MVDTAYLRITKWARIAFVVSTMAWLAIGLLEVGTHSSAGVAKSFAALVSVLTLPFLLLEQWRSANRASRMAWVGLFVTIAILVAVVVLWPR